MGGAATKEEEPEGGEGEEHEESEEEIEEPPEPPPAGRVLLRGCFAGSVITSEHCLETALPIDYEVDINDVEPILKAFLKASKQLEAKAKHEAEEKEEKKRKAKKEARENGKAEDEEEEGEEEEHKAEELPLASSDSWQKFITILTADTWDLDAVAQDDAAHPEIKRLRPYKAKLEALQVDFDVLAQSLEDVKVERSELAAENEAMHQTLEDIKEGKSGAPGRQVSGASIGQALGASLGRSKLQNENDALRKELANMSAGKPAAAISEKRKHVMGEANPRADTLVSPPSSPHNKPAAAPTHGDSLVSPRSGGPEGCKDVAELKAQIADLQRKLRDQPALHEQALAPRSAGGICLAVHGAFVGKVSTDTTHLEVSLPVKGDLPLHLVLDTVTELKASAVIQAEEHLQIKEEKERKQAAKEAAKEAKEAAKEALGEGAGEEENEEEGEESEEEEEEQEEEPCTSPEVWSQLLDVLLDKHVGKPAKPLTGLAAVVAAARQKKPEEPAPTIQDSAPTRQREIEGTGSQEAMRTRISEMQELKRLTELNRMVVESLDASELEVQTLRREMEQKFRPPAATLGERQLPTSSTMQGPANPLLRPASLPTLAAHSLPASGRTTSSPLNEPPLHSQSARGPHAAPRSRKLASALSTHVQELEKWASELNSFSNGQ